MKTFEKMNLATSSFRCGGAKPKGASWEAQNDHFFYGENHEKEFDNGISCFDGLYFGWQ
jgi:hypothetical protein